MQTALLLSALGNIVLLGICIILGRRIDLVHKRIDLVHERITLTCLENGLRDFWNTQERTKGSENAKA